MTSSNNKLITDKEFNDIDIWETEEGRIKGLFYMFRQYINSDYKDIDIPKTLDRNNIDLFTNTVYYDYDFRRFACDNYRIALEYYEKEDELSIMKF